MIVPKFNLIITCECNSSQQNRPIGLTNYIQLYRALEWKILIKFTSNCFICIEMHSLHYQFAVIGTVKEEDAAAVNHVTPAFQRKLRRLVLCEFPFWPLLLFLRL